MRAQKLQLRYLAALPRGGGKVFLSWRLLRTDRPDEPFHVERRRVGGRNWRRVTSEPVTDSTNFLDRPSRTGPWAYRVVSGDGTASESVQVDSSAPATICAVDAPLAAPMNGAWRIGLGDLDNDGRIDYVVPSMVGGELVLHAYRWDGKPMWRFPTGLPLAAGDMPYTIWDVNADGRTEVVLRRGGRAWSGELARIRRGEEPSELPANATAIPAGETLTALDGATGEIVWEVPLEGKQLFVKTTAAHVRGVDAPAAIGVTVGTYADVWNTAYDGRDGHVLWRAHQDRGTGHSLDVADIDGDGVQEIISGGVCYNGDGTVRWQAEPFGHTDISKPARIDPAREGLQVWYAVEGPPTERNGVYLVDADGRTIFSEPFRHAHYGWVARHTSKVPGLQPHTAEDARHEYGAADDGMRRRQHNPIFLPDGTHWLNLTEWQRKNFVPVHWDAGREVVFAIRKENKRIVRLLETGQIEDVPEGELPQGGRYGRNLGCADVMGDFRENIVTVDDQRQRLIVLLNPTVCRRRGHSPYEDFEYRHDRSQHGSGYYIYLSPPEASCP